MRNEPENLMPFPVDRAALEAACRELGVELLVLFGSAAKGTATAESDLDAAVVLKESEVTLPRYLDLFTRLDDLVGKGRLHLVFLQGASPLLRFQVAKTGHPFYEDPPGRFRRFQVSAFKAYQDTVKFRRLTAACIRSYLEGQVPRGRSRVDPPKVATAHDLPR